MDRRRFLQGALGVGVGAGAGWALAGPARAALPVPLVSLAALPVGALRVFEAPASELGAEPIVVARQAGGLVLLSGRCTHLGCTLRPAGRELRCPCHVGRFGLDGSVLSGPPPRPLRWLWGELGDDGLLYVHLGRENRERRLLSV